MKLTLTQLQSVASAYVDKARIAGAWNASRNNMAGLLDKVGKLVTIDGEFGDKLPELDGDNLPFGKTIEEYMIDLTMPTCYNGSALSTANIAGCFPDAKGLDTNIKAAGATVVEPALPSAEDASYSFTLGRFRFKTTVPYDNYERACLTGQDAANITAKVFEKFTQSAALTKYAIKKQLLGVMATKAVDAGLVESIAKPVDAETGEAFIKLVKEKVEDMSFANEGNSLSKTLIGATPAANMVLYVSKKVMPSLEVDTKAGAFHTDMLDFPARIKVVDDFGNADSKVYAMLVDDRGIKLHNGYNATRSGTNEDGDFENIVHHEEYTAFLSKYTYVRVFKESN